MVLVATSDLAAQSDSAARTGTAKPASLAGLDEALAATEATLAELSLATEAVAMVRELRQELQVVNEQNQLLSSDLASAEREREEANGTIDQLRRRLAAAGQQVNTLEATNASLSADLQAFQAAADDAAGGLRQNLETIQSRIETLTAELRSAAQGTPGADASSAGSAAGQAVAADSGRGANGLAGAEPSAPAEATASSPEVQALLTELRPAIDHRGLLLSVPGGELFRIGSDEIQQASFPTLAKVAELINTYSDREVLILGHTDASGEDSYNQVLSKRRAELVKQFLVDNFDIDEARLLTLGKGEEAPIASNDTAAGREANRRIEVLLLN